ncbi:MAG: HEAT repeat domain-containing protein [Nitrospirales bacterium]|nr:HEAT repeat domain-containing protein [Nitrospirales bacterium]
MGNTVTISKSLKDLSHRDPSRRRRAAEALAGGDERAIYPLIRALRDGSSGVQDAAMRSLIAIGGETTAYMVIPLLREEAYLRNTALIILREIGSPTIPLLYPLLKDKDDDIRKFGLDLIIDIAQGGDHERIIPMLRDPNRNVRASAAKAAGVVMGSAAVPWLVGALEDDEWVAFSALEALSAIRDGSSAQAIQTLLDSPSMVLRLAAMESLGSIGSPDATGPLLSHLRQAEGIEKGEAVKALVRIGVTPEVSGISDILRDMLKNGDWDERMIALRGIVDLHEEKAVRDIADTGGSLDPADPESEDKLAMIREAMMALGCSDSLIGCLTDSSLGFRGKVLAVDVIGALRCRKAVPHLRKLFGGDLRDIRRASIRALSVMDDEEALQDLRHAISDRDSHVRKAAVSAIGRIGDTASFDPILALLREEQFQDVIEEALRALIGLDHKRLLSRLGDLDSVCKEVLARQESDQALLMDLLTDESRSVRVAAVARLGIIGADAAAPRLRELAGDPDPVVRKAVVVSLGELGCCRDILETALHDEDIWVRSAAIKAVGFFDDDVWADLLVPMLGDKEIQVVMAVIDAIAQRGGREAVRLLVELEDHENPVIREKAAQVLLSL